MIDTAAALVGDEGVREIIAGRNPDTGVVAGSTVRADCTLMEDRVNMAGDAGSRKSAKFAVGVTLRTFHANVCARQWEIG